MDANEGAVGLATQAEALICAGRQGDALVLLSLAQRSYPADLPILRLISRAFIDQGRTDSAIGALLAAVEIAPQDVDLHHALAILLFRAGQVHEALAHGIQAFERSPTAGHATALGTVLIDLGQYHEALGLFDHALGLNPADWEARNNRALALQGLGRFEEAIIAGQEAVETAPTNPTIRFNLACALLGMGQMTAYAWDLFEARLELAGNLPWVQDLAARRWRGEAITNQTILLHAEQGFGDTIQFIRYLPLVARRARHVVVAVQPPLLSLLRGMGIEAAAIGTPLPPFDVMAPLLSLPGLFGTTLDTVPPILPWLGPSHTARQPERVRKVGLAWRGSSTFADDRQRSLPIECLSRLAGIPGLSFVSLQKHEPDRREWPGGLGLTDAMAGVTGFDETAAIMAGLDLVITVDTSVAHLAAAIGLPVWLLTRWRGCWRWLHHRTDSPWYPTMRLFRQSQPNDWTDTIDDLHVQLVSWSKQATRRVGFSPPESQRTRPAI